VAEVKSAYQSAEYPYLDQECFLIRSACEQRKPVLGLCLGGQLIARSLGAEVKARSAKRNWFSASIPSLPRKLPLIRWSHCFRKNSGAAHWHGDVFEIPSGGVRMASSALTEQSNFSATPRMFTPFSSTSK
jgi:GMP synthase-like glutamine amidotransferase